jgi:hypothetical protein
MKKLYPLLLVLVLSFPVHAQTAWKQPFPVDSTTGVACYQGVRKVSGAKADLLFNRAKEWHAKAAVPETKEPLVADEAAGLFIGKSSALLSDGERLVFTLAIECKAEQYAFLITEIQLVTEQREAPELSVPGRSFVKLGSSLPILEVATMPRNLTEAGEVKPIVQKQLIKANATLEKLTVKLQQAMEKPNKS